MAEEKKVESGVAFFVFLGVMLLMGALNYARGTNGSPPPRPEVNQSTGSTYNTSVDTEAARIKKQVTESGTLVSPYKGRVRIESYQYNSDPNQEYITLSITGSEKDLIPISGWKVESDTTGRGRPIPNGVTLPFPGSINVEQTIFAKSGDKIVLVSGRSPMGYSFKANICSGYFTRFQTYVPYLSAECPRPEKSTLPKRPNHLEDRCLDYLDGLPTCFLPTATLPQDLSRECQGYIANNYNYNSCVSNSKNRSDFYRKEWRVYLNSGEGLWKSRRETIQILDADGRVVTSVSY